MDILFIIPSPDRPQIEHVGLCPSLGLGSICTYLSVHGITCKIIDMYAEYYSKSRLKKEIEKYNPKMVGLQMFSESFSVGCEISQICKELNPDIYNFAGGVDATFRGEVYLKECSSIDFIITFEGEMTILELYKECITKKEFQKISGIIYRHNNKIIKNKTRSPLNLDELPIANREFFDLDKYIYPYTVVTSKGCPYACLFCGGGAFGRGYQESSLEHIDKELKYISEIIMKRGEKEDHHLIFWDDAFTVFPERAISIGKIAKKYGIKWGCQCRINEVNLEHIQQMKDNNCQKLNFGVETGDKRVLKDIDKGIELEDVVNIAHFCSQIELPASFNFILPFPTDTEESLKNTLKFAEEIDALDYISVSFNANTPFPGTYMYNNANSLKIKFVSNNEADFSFKNPIFTTENLDMNTIKKYFTKAIMLEARSKEDKKKLQIKY